MGYKYYQRNILKRSKILKTENWSPFRKRRAYCLSPPTNMRITGMNSRSKTIAPNRKSAIPRKVNARETLLCALDMVVFMIPVKIGKLLKSVPTMKIPMTMKIAPPTTIPIPARVASPIASES